MIVSMPAWQAALDWRRCLWLLSSLLFFALSASVILGSRGAVQPHPTLNALLAVLAVSGAGSCALGRWRRRWWHQFSAYVGPQVFQVLGHHAKGVPAVRRPVAVLFADIRQFTPWVETVDSGHAWETLNRYYATVVPVVHEWGGSIDHFRGDGLMAIFGAPGSLAHPCTHAVMAARQIHAAVSRFNRDQARRGGSAFSVTMGIAFGEAVCGELGCASRKGYTAIGDAVNVAARLQELAKRLGETILLTESVASQLIWRPRSCRYLGCLPMRGHSPVQVCALAGERAPEDHLLEASSWPMRRQCAALTGVIDRRLPRRRISRSARAASSRS